MKNLNQPKGEIVIYKANDGSAQLDVKLEEENVWLTQKQMSLPIDKNIRTINEDIKNVFLEGELLENSVIRNFRITASDGKVYNTKFYNLDVIIFVGYRVKSKIGTQFGIGLKPASASCNCYPVLKHKAIFFISNDLRLIFKIAPRFISGINKPTTPLFLALAKSFILNLRIFIFLSNNERIYLCHTLIFISM